MNRILCPVDLTPQSNEAVRYAISLAQSYRAELLICHCVESSPFAVPSERPEVRKLFEDLIRSQGIPLNEKQKFEGVVVNEDPVEAIPRLAAEYEIDLIVMRSRRRPRAAALLGSTAEAVCRTAPCPVLVTHPDEREFVNADAQELALRRILVAHDYSNDSELALSYGISLAQEYQAELHLIHVIPGPGVTEAFLQAAPILSRAVPDEVYLWCQVKNTIRAGQPYREILDYAEEQQIDLICMGSHGANFAMRALFGSNVDRVLRQAPCPVLIARPLKPAVRVSELEPKLVSRIVALRLA